MRQSILIVLILQILTAPVAFAGTAKTPSADEALRERLITRALRQQVGKDEALLGTLVDLARRAREVGADDRLIHKLQREVRRGRNLARRARIEVELVVDAAERQGVFTRRQADAVGDDPARLLTLLQAKQLVGIGALTEAQLSVVRFDRERIQTLLDVFTVGRALRLPLAEIRSAQHRVQKAGRRLTASAALSRLIVDRFGLPRAALRARLSPAALIETAARAVWLAPEDTAWRTVRFWERVRRVGSKAALIERFLALAPDLSDELRDSLEIDTIVEGAGAARLLGADATRSAYWQDLAAVKREAMDGETFSSRWYDAARATPQPEIADEAPRTDVPEAINKLLTYCEHVLQQQLWLMPETNLHPEREDSLVHRVREMAPALAYVPASATRN